MFWLNFIRGLVKPGKWYLVFEGHSNLAGNKFFNLKKKKKKKKKSVFLQTFFLAML